MATTLKALASFSHTPCAILFLLWFPLQATGQDRLPLTELSLETMREFSSPSPNWQLAGKVESDRDQRWSLVAKPGTGILANLVSEKANGNLFTTWGHGDIELELDFMMPKGSNSGIYLQGRYEVQLLDSWGVRNPTFSDCGGIYERWDDSRPEGQHGYEGQPPRFNASRAPGLWQHYKIIFRAPRFDEAGSKIANARFVRVEHNGVVVHENIEVTGPTRASAFDDERPTGPLMIQGMEGPIALRNIRFKRYNQERVQVSDVSFKFYQGGFEQIPDLTRIRPSMEGRTEGLTWDLGANPDTFLVSFAGTMKTPSAGTYRFMLALDWINSNPGDRDNKIGGGLLHVGGLTALEHNGRRRAASGEINLDAGEHPFTLTYFKNRRRRAPTMALYVEGPDTPLHNLNAPGSEPEVSPVGAILVEPSLEPVILRSFMEHRGRKRTHVVSVGEPSGIHYALDTSQAALLRVWKGPFLDTTPMWYGRGQDQLALPQGSGVTLRGNPSLAFLEDKDASWPDSVDLVTAYDFLGYDLDSNGRPMFRYNLGEVGVEDRLVPDENARYLTRYLTLRAGKAQPPLWLRVAAGTDIRAVSDKNYAVGGRMYYVEILESGDARPILRNTVHGVELLIPIQFQGPQAAVSYSIIW